MYNTGVELWFAKMFRRYPIKSQRALEILPGAVSWSLILFPFWGSLIIPAAVAYYVLAFSVYWLYRSLSMAALAIVAHYKVLASQRHHWNDELQLLPDHEKMSHLIIIPTYMEPLSTLQRTLTHLSQQTFDKKRLYIMLSFEEREGQDAKDKAAALISEYGDIFGGLWTTMHPDIEGEVKGKSSNTAWGAKELIQIVRSKKGFNPDFATISSEDADALYDPQYFAALSVQFLNNKDRYYRIWQGSIRFYNNIWTVPAPVRVLASIFSVTQLFILMRRDRLVNFSTYTTSLKLAEEIGLWDVDVIPEDYRFFFKAYFATKGRVEVEPIFLPINADAAEAKGFWSTMYNQYEQVKRWAWGASDDAYIIKKYLTAPGVPFFDKTIRVLKVVEDHFLWPVNWFALTIGALLPPLLNQDFARTVLGKTLPQTTSAIMTLALVALLVIFVIDARNRPPRPDNKKGIFRVMLQPLEFVLLPVVGFFFSALPGIDAHTRLMLGKYIEYRVTEKV